MRRLTHWLIASVLLSTVLHAQSPDAELPTMDEAFQQSDDDQAVENPEQPSQLTQEQDLQKRKLEIGMILASGIFLMGMFLVILTLIYGRRTRRQLAAGRGESQPRDELWYLKHRKEVEHSSEQDETQEDSR